MITTFCPKCHRPYDVSLGECPVCSRKSVEEHNRKMRKKFSLDGILSAKNEKKAKSAKRANAQEPPKVHRKKPDPDATVILRRSIPADLPPEKEADQTRPFAPVPVPETPQDAPAAPPVDSVPETPAPARPAPAQTPVRQPRPAVQQTPPPQRKSNPHPAKKQRRSVPILAILLCIAILALLTIGAVAIFRGLGDNQIQPVASTSESGSVSEVLPTESTPVSSAPAEDPDENKDSNENNKKNNKKNNEKEDSGDSSGQTTPATEPSDDPSGSGGTTPATEPGDSSGGTTTRPDPGTEGGNTGNEGGTAGGETGNPGNEGGETGNSGNEGGNTGGETTAPDAS